MLQTIIGGASYVVRWQDNRKKGILTFPEDPTVFLGFPASPIWTNKLFMQINEFFIKDISKILLFVGDYRFGNTLFSDNVPSNKIFLDGYQSISKKYINPEYDKQLLKRCEAALDRYSDTYGNNIQILHWALLGRQVFDRLQGRHIKEKKYHHPIWNLSTQMEKRGENFLDLRPLLKCPMDEVVRMFLDSDLHPTYIGYLFLEKSIFQKKTVREALEAAIDYTMWELLYAVLQEKKNTQSILILCSSVWGDTLCRYLSLSGKKRFKEYGIDIFNLKEKKDWKPFSSTDYAKVLIISSEPDISIFLNEYNYIISLLKKIDSRRVCYIPWESTAKWVLQNSKRNYQLLETTKIIQPIDEQTALRIWGDYSLGTNFLQLVEVGVRCQPNMNGLKHVLRMLRFY